MISDKMVSGKIKEKYDQTPSEQSHVKNTVNLQLILGFSKQAHYMVAG